MSRERPIPAVKALIEKNNKFLILKTRVDDGHIWTLPGGRIEYGENPVEALHREVEEETSLNVTLKDCVGMYHFFTEPEDSGDQIVSTVYTVEISNGIVNINSNPADEHIEGYQWIRPQKFLEKKCNDNLKQLIQEQYDLK